MTTKYIMIHASKMVKAPVEYDKDGGNPILWDEISYRNKIQLCHDEIMGFDSDDWDIITYDNIDSENNPNPKNIKEKNKSA